MATGQGIRPQRKRSRTGCLTCRRAKVRCSEEKPWCTRCARLKLHCVWQPRDEDLQLSIATIGRKDAPETVYVHHFAAFCTRFLAYSNDGESNPFARGLVPLAPGSPALHHSMTALAAAHLAKRGGQTIHATAARFHYTQALSALSNTLGDIEEVRSDATLGACLLLCVYESCYSGESLWLRHLRGARDLIKYRRGLSTDHFLLRFFSLLDISGSLLASQNTLLPGNYWLPAEECRQVTTPWPDYDGGVVMVDNYHALMVYMARLSALSRICLTASESSDVIEATAAQISSDMLHWWETQADALRCQSNTWRNNTNLSKKEKLQGESFSSTRSVVYGCKIYLHHILNPCQSNPIDAEVETAIVEILEIAQNTPEGDGLEMGLLFALFMVGIAIWKDAEKEELIRQKMASDRNIAIFHADHALRLLEELWTRQRSSGKKLDWRLLQQELGLQIFILV